MQGAHSLPPRSGEGPSPWDSSHGPHPSVTLCRVASPSMVLKGSRPLLSLNNRPLAGLTENKMLKSKDRPIHARFQGLTPFNDPIQVLDYLISKINNMLGKFSKQTMVFSSIALLSIIMISYFVAYKYFSISRKKQILIACIATENGVDELNTWKDDILNNLQEIQPDYLYIGEVNRIAKIQLPIERIGYPGRIYNANLPTCINSCLSKIDPVHASSRPSIRIMDSIGIKNVKDSESIIIYLPYNLVIEVFKNKDALKSNFPPGSSSSSFEVHKIVSNVVIYSYYKD